MKRGNAQKLCGIRLTATTAFIAFIACGCSPAAKTCASRNDGIIPATPADRPIECPVTIPADTLAAERAACTFTPGARTAETLGIPADVSKKIPIGHIIVLMKENRAFDHLFGKLHDEGQPGTDAVPATFANPDRNSVPVAPFHAFTTCYSKDPAHQYDAMCACVDDGKMDGFVVDAASSTKTDGHFVMSYYQQTDLPFYYWLARTWALNDRHFTPVRSGTDSNRDFMYLGTNDGVVNTNDRTPDPSLPSIFTELADADLTWGAYSDGALLSGSLGWGIDDPGCHCFDEFMARLDSGTLPNVSFVDGVDDVEDDHVPSDIQRGEAWVRNIYAHAIRSPQWPRTAIVLTWDEGGGFADHLPPPDNACIARPIPLDQPFHQLGPRVPLIVISPYSLPGYVSHVVQDHTAITRFIEAVFDLPALTARDANSDALLDMLEFPCAPPMLNPPAAPAAGVLGCVVPGL